MSSTVTVVAIAAGAALVGAGLGWGGRRVAWPQYARRAAARRFAREFAALVRGTDLDLATLRGPGCADGHGGGYGAGSGGRASQGFASAAVGFVEPTADTSMLAPRALSLEDQDYYAESWRNVEGEFAECPASALLLATHLTANLLLNRGLLPADTARPSVLPESWAFPSARGYRDALRISARMDEGGGVTEAELTTALGLFEDFYWEMLTLTAAAE